MVWKNQEWFIWKMMKKYKKKEKKINPAREMAQGVWTVIVQAWGPRFESPAILQKNTCMDAYA